MAAPEILLRSWKIFLNNAGVPFTAASVPPCGLPTPEVPAGASGSRQGAKLEGEESTAWKSNIEDITREMINDTHRRVLGNVLLYTP